MTGAAGLATFGFAVLFQPPLWKPGRYLRCLHEQRRLAASSLSTEGDHDHKSAGSDHDSSDSDVEKEAIVGRDRHALVQQQQPQRQQQTRSHGDQRPAKKDDDRRATNLAVNS